jgi:hypothetical protein
MVEVATVEAKMKSSQLGNHEDPAIHAGPSFVQPG